MHTSGPQRTWYCWRPSDLTVLNASDAALSLLMKGCAPRMVVVALNRDFISAVGTAQLHCASWDCVKVCCLSNVGLTSAALQAFCTSTWPQMRRLDLSHNQLGAAAITHLGAVSWPC